MRVEKKLTMDFFSEHGGDFSLPASLLTPRSLGNISGSRNGTAAECKMSMDRANSTLVSRVRMSYKLTHRTRNAGEKYQRFLYARQ